MTTQTLLQSLAGQRYLVRKKVFKLLGEAFHVYDEQGTLVLYCKLKAFKLREDIRLYASETEELPVLTIKARNIIDFSAAYDVIDMTVSAVDEPGPFQPGQTLNYAATADGGRKVGALRRKGFSSLFRDSWEILDAGDQGLGVIREDSGVKAFVRRFIDTASTFMPQVFYGEIQGQRVFEFRQNYNPFVRKLALDFSGDAHGRLDRRLGIAAAILLAAIEGRQN